MAEPSPRRLIIAMSGASGAILGIRVLEILRREAIETHLVISKAARLTIQQETDWELKNVLALASHSYSPADVGAAIASGSFHTDGMAVIPCSIKTLSAIANSYTDDLISRAADVCLKEGRPLLLAVRETPLQRGHLRLMLQAAENGAVIMPPMPAFYTRPQTLDDMVNNLAGRILARLGVQTAFYQVWQGVEPNAGRA